MTSDRFTLSFCRSRARVLMLRRSRPPFAGLWNGLGGKVEPDETDEASALREVWEEAGIGRDDVARLVRIGDVSWEISQAGRAPSRGSMAVYLVDLVCGWECWEGVRDTPEGGLAWWPEGALRDRDEPRIVPNIPLIYPAMLADDALAEYHCRYEGNRLLSVERRLDGSRQLRYPAEASERRRTSPDG
ncbi:MAG TPA: NUDIX domain-containing protein [Actinomycetes bacterium]